MKNGVFVEFKPDGTEVQIVGNGIDVLKAMELVLNALDESLGSTMLGDDILERLSEKRKRSREEPSDKQCIINDAIEKIKSEKPSGLIGLLLMMEAINAIKNKDDNPLSDCFMGVDMASMHGDKTVFNSINNDLVDLLKRIKASKHDKKNG